MPYRDSSIGSPTWPGPGDDDMADFINDVWQPFATDAKASGGLGWIQQNPAGGAGGGGTHPNFQRLFSRGTIGSEAPPYIFFQTTAKTLYIFSGSGVNTAQEPYDQPGNPMNHPIDASFADPGASSNMGNLKCLAMTSMIGPYDDYWVFGGPTGEYLHCVVKVSAREYRHFHVGMATRLHTDLDADTFYVTNHRWSNLGTDNLIGQAQNTGNNQNFEHQPYYAGHHLPFRNNDQTNANDVRSTGMWLYSPAYGTLNHDWWIMTGREVTANAGSIVGRAQNSSGNYSPATATTKNIGDVNNASDAVLFGGGAVTGYDKTLGTTLFAADTLFTTDGVALVPIYMLLPSDIESDIRWAPVARVPDVYRVNMNTLDAEQEITVGSDTFTVFPMINKDSANTLDNEGYSGYEGLAYKKITANAT